MRSGRPSEDPRHALELEILRVEAQLDQLSRKHKSLKRALNDRFCPVLQLPNEVSSEIFMHCLRRPNKELVTPFQLGHICQAWRDLVLSSTRLWSIITLNFRYHSSCDLIQEWLVRSGEQPLVVDFTWEPWSNDEYVRAQEEKFQDVMGVLIRFSARWRIVDFFLPNYWDVWPITRDALRRPLPLLTSMSLRNLDILGDILHSAPHLDEIHLVSSCIQDYSFLSPNITRVSLTHVSIDTCLVVLSNIPCLQHCAIFKITTQAVESKVVVLATHLESLAITFGRVSQLPGLGLLDFITTPVLHELAICAVTTSSLFPFSGIMSLVARSSCTLRSLSLSGPGIHGSGLFECLQWTPLLSELNLTSASLRNEFIQLLSLSSNMTPRSSGYLLPLLQLFTYEGQIDMTSVDMIPILLGRWELGVEGKIASLKRIHLRIIPHNAGSAPTLPQHPQQIAEGMFLFIEKSS